LAGDGGFLLLNFALLLLDSLMFFEKLIEQHRVHCFVTNGCDFPGLIAHYQIRVYFFYLFGD